ncbi:MAG: hypothetical protein K6L80_00445 [Agarilytica sp.]
MIFGKCALPQSLWVAIRLTHLPLEALGVQRHTPNIMVSDKNTICATSDNLHDLGIEPGTSTTTAQLLHSNDNAIPYKMYERELDSEAQSLKIICEALYNITPHIERNKTQYGNTYDDIGVIIEVSRCINLFKGLDSLLNAMKAALAPLAFSYIYALGHTKQIAWLLTYANVDQNLKTISDSKDFFINQLKALPLTLIHEHPNSVIQLNRSGFFTFNDLISHIETASFHSLRKRFSEDFCQYLADMLGIDNTLQQGALFKAPVDTYHPEHIFIESIQFDYPVSNCEQLAHPIKTLLTDLTNELVKQQRQTQQLFWHLYDIYQNQENFSVCVERLHSDANLAKELTMIHLENQPLPFEVDVLELRCEHIFPVHFENRNTHNDHQYDIEQHALATVTAKLNARLGEKSVFSLSPKDSHIPEFSFSKTNICNIKPSTKLDSPTVRTDRPSWIFNIPVKIGQQQNALFWKGRLELLQGPERIEGLWWKKPTGRDYFVAKRDDHVRLWVFHDLYKNEWFAHGVFS